jgi:hypothetical protein
MLSSPTAAEEGASASVPEVTGRSTVSPLSRLSLPVRESHNPAY